MYLEGKRNWVFCPTVKAGVSQYSGGDGDLSPAKGGREKKRGCIASGADE